jgi:hypothetical protein
MPEIVGPDELLKSFQTFAGLRENMIENMTALNTKHATMKRVYSEFIAEHSTRGTFGIDSYGFATKLHKLQFDTICEMKRLIDNRIYGEFYKLRKMMIAFASEQIVESVNTERMNEISNKTSKYPKFKDIVDADTLYSFDMTTDIFADIVSLLRILMTHMEAKSKQLADSESRTKKGMNVHNLVSAYRYDTNMLNEKISLFSSYVTTFVSYHTKYVERVVEKVSALDGQISTDTVDAGV